MTQGKSYIGYVVIIGADEEAGSQRNDRSRWLAAWAHMEYGDYFAEEFTNTRLYLPLVKSLPKKQDFLEKASTSYQKSADLGFLEFISMSSYKLAGLYSSLAIDLRNAPQSLKVFQAMIWQPIVRLLDNRRSLLMS